MDAIDRINAILKERGMSGADLSRKIGVSTAVYSQWNRKKTKPSNKNIARVAEALGVSVSDLTGEGQKEKPAPVSGSGPVSPPGYELLTPENRAKADSYLAFLLAEQQKGQT